jgi:altered-inheritance-of-mitochondria protein 5
LETGRTSRATLVETAKDRWNAEIQNAVRWVQGAEWGNVKEGMEGAVAKALGTGLEKSREEIQLAEDKAGPIAREAIDRARQGAKMGFDGSRVAAERAASRALSATSERESKFEGKTEHGLENASATAKEAWRKGVEKSHEVAERLRLGEESAAHAARRELEKSAEAAHEIGKREGIYGDKTEHGLENAGPVARETWSKGVEKGREIEKGLGLTETAAENAVRGAARHEASKAAEVAEGLKLTEEGVVGAVKRTVARGKEVVENAMGRTSGHEEADGLTDVQRALKQRYDAASPLNKSVRETLAERYTPADQKSNSNLRGL